MSGKCIDTHFSISLNFGITSLITLITLHLINYINYILVTKIVY